MKKTIISLAAFSPTLAFAQSYNVSTFQGAVAAVTNIINLVFPVFVGIAVFMVAWGIFKFVLNAGDPEARKKGAATILWGVIGVFLMISIWGLINILKNTFNLNNTPIEPPSLLPQ